MDAVTDSSQDEDAVGEPDGDYDSETPPAAEARSSRSNSSTSQDSQRPPKRKASDGGEDDEDFMNLDPALYGLRRSVRGSRASHKHRLTHSQGRARPTRRIVGNPSEMAELASDTIQVDSSDEDDQSESPEPRKRQRTASRKSTLPWPDKYKKYTHRRAASTRPTPVYQSAGSESGSDDYVGARRNIPTKKQRQRQMLVAAGHLPPSQAEVRFSSRRTKAVTNYNEDDQDDFEEDDDDEATPSYGWAATVEETGPAIDKVLDHRPKEGIGRWLSHAPQVSS